MISSNRRLVALSTMLVLAVAVLVVTQLVRGRPLADADPDSKFRMMTAQRHPPRVPTRGQPAAYQKPYVFHTDWFSHNVPLWKAALEPYRGRPDVAYLEIGVYEGRSALWVMENILTHPTARLTGIDPFGDPDAPDLAEHGRTFFANLELSGHASKATIIRGYSQVEMRKLPLQSFDIIYIDGSHTAADALEDALLSRRLLKEHAVLIFDDYLWQLSSRPADRPKVAIDWFYTLFRDEFDVIDSSYQAILKKRVPSASR